MNRRAALLLAARLSSALTTVGVLVLLARLRGSEELGLVSLGFATGAILAVVSDAGTSSLLIREGARRPAELGRLFAAAVGLRIVLVPAVLAVAWLLLSVAFGASTPAVWLAAAGLAMQQAAELTRSVALARDRVLLLAVHSIAENVVWILAITLLLFSGASLEAVLLGGLLVFAGSVLAGLAIVRLRLGVRMERPPLAWATDLARATTPFTLFAVFGTTYSRIDTVLVGLLAPGSAIVAAGAYFASARLVAAFEYLPDALGRSLMPELSRSYVTDRGGMRGALGRPARFLLYAGVPIPFVTILAGPWVLDLLFGPEVASYAWVLVILAVLVPFRSLGQLFGVALTSADAQWRRVAAAGLALVAVALIDVLLLPTIGIAAALLGAVVASVIVMTVYAIGVVELVGPLTLVADAARAGVAAGVAFAGGALASTLAPPPVAAVVFGAIYVVAVVLIDRTSWPPIWDATPMISMMSGVLVRGSVRL